MKIETLNRLLLISWLLVTAGACYLNLGAGLVVSGTTLAFLTLYLARRAGIYAETKEGD